MLEAIEHHLEILTKQLISEDVLESVDDTECSSRAGLVLQETLSLSTVLARVAGVSENYSELQKGHDLISFTVEMVQNLLKLVSGETGSKRGKERGKAGRKGKAHTREREKRE